MTDHRIERQEHGYRNGHQLLSSSLRLARNDQDALDQLSDMAGPLRPGETFEPYLSAYPLPSGNFYVVARTWQDVDAPRAGCVRTRSILIPMRMWEVMESLQQILAPLASPMHTGETILLEQAPVGKVLPIVYDSRTPELIEALFLGQRDPIVFFEAPESELMTVRLLSALWPALRRNFAVCSFALAPRKIEERDFDLLFAPKSARTRFAGCPHRRIGEGNSSEPKSHWTAAVASKIFQSSNPSLTADDALGVLTSDLRGDASALRLSLLWNELAMRVEANPTAVLGLLDIINSQRELTINVIDSLSSLSLSAIRLAGEVLPSAEAWYFLVALAGKLPPQVRTKLLLHEIRVSASNLALLNPEATFGFLTKGIAEDRTIPVVVLAGLGNGLGLSKQLGDYCNELAQLPPQIGLQMIAESASFAESFVAMAVNKPLVWIPILFRLLEAGEGELGRMVRRRLVPLLDDGKLAPLLPPIIRGIPAQELVDIAVQIGHQTKFRMRAFDEPITNAAFNCSGVQVLRNTVAMEFDSESANRFLLGTLNLNGIDIEWLCTGPIRQDRARWLAFQLLEDSSDSALLAVQAEEETRERILELLLGDPPKCATQIARFLSLAEISLERLLDISPLVLPQLEPEARGLLLKRLINRVLAEAKLIDKRVLSLLERADSDIEPTQLVRIAARKVATPQQIANNLVNLEEGPDAIRRRVIDRIDDLSSRLVKRRDNLGEAAYLAWASFIKDAAIRDRDAQHRAAGLTLSYALGSVEKPVSGLVMACFPIVYANISTPIRYKDQDSNVILSKLSQVLSSGAFGAKFAQRKLERLLIEAFLSSSWPPADLLLTAMAAGVGKRIVDMLQRSKKGKRYIRAIQSDSRRLQQRVRKQVKHACKDSHLSTRVLSRK